MKYKLVCSFVTVFVFGLLAAPCDVHLNKKEECITMAAKTPAAKKCTPHVNRELWLSDPLSFFTFN